MIAAFFLGGIIVAIVFYFKRRYPSTNKDIEAFLKTYRYATPKRYTYNDLKKITSSFENRLGEGGYGAVYKGDLPTGNPVAVKILKKSKGNAEEFINEVASIGRTNHVNIVKLLGFCVEGHKRALLYDFMPNGSLDRFIYDGGSNERSLSLEDLFPIAVGIARGLEYLHQGCNTRILHFDIKPHNILLDESFCPKISDFGLAKPCLQKDSIISMSGARGTIGYIAPEVFLRNFGGVSYKSDVYSYGMLVLEMLGCRRNGKARAECSSAQYFPQWIYNQLEQGEELNDEGMMNGKERELHKKMVVVSLWCIQTNPSSRPSMTTVVDMLEGTIESLQIPPMPSLATPPRSRRNSSTTLKISTSATPSLSMNPIQEASMDIKTSHLP